ncbi:metallophosphoesterase family protein [Desulfocurvibacter africanus]|uniref:metallophosphoesterase family protein n=1 Tax=Desulfocurvibacter africanus TaxID=873 RepID=UPI0005532A6B|nr:metallophosphoesterase [Desulfocurvibacter africanus]
MILFCGDPHGQFASCLSRAEQARPEHIVLLGDQTPHRPLKIILGDWWQRTWFILGNHDTDAPEYLVCHRGDMWEHNLHAHVQVLGGLRVAGLGGVFRERVWYPGKAPRFRTRAQMREHVRPVQRFLDDVPLTHWSTIFPEDIEALREQKADILVTHEAPESHPYGFSAIGDLARSMGVEHLIHGHHHEENYTVWIKGGISVWGVNVNDTLLWPGNLMSGEAV